MPTSLDNHKLNLRKLVRSGMSVLDLGLRDGVSTKEFLDAGCTVDTVDLIKSMDFREERWCFHKENVSDIIREFLEEGEKFNLVFCDITYYDEAGLEYGSKEAFSFELERLRLDLPICWELLESGGKLVINDYINSCGKRSAPRIAFNEFACAMNKPFAVYPTRGGMAVLCK